MLRQVGTDGVELRALIGDNQVGHQWLHARYLRAGLTVVNPGFGEDGIAFEILRDELTVQDGSFVHGVIT